MVLRRRVISVRVQGASMMFVLYTNTDQCYLDVWPSTGVYKYTSSSQVSFI